MSGCVFIIVSHRTYHHNPSNLGYVPCVYFQPDKTQPRYPENWLPVLGKALKCSKNVLKRTRFQFTAERGK